MSDLFYGSIAVGPIIVAIIALLKQIGLPDKYATWTNVGLSLLFVVLIYLTGIYPQIQQPVVMVINLVITLLVAAGVYDIQKNVTRAVRKE